MLAGTVTVSAHTWTPEGPTRGGGLGVRVLGFRGLGFRI